MQRPRLLPVFTAVTPLTVIAAAALLTLLAAAALLLAPRSAHAQLGIGIAGGPSFPMGDLGDLVESGFHGGVVVDVAIPLFPIGVRGDLMYQRLSGTGDRGDYDNFSATVNGRVTLLPLPLVSGYVTAGAGVYSSDFRGDRTGTGSGRETEPGLNGGIGLRLNALLIRGFVEARYHRVMTDPARAFVPITVGVIF